MDSDLLKRIESFVDKILPTLVQDYRRLHAAPELSHYEQRTALYLSARLRDLGYEVTYPYGAYPSDAWLCHGVVALWRNGSGPCVLYRADLDALPIEEKTGLPYASVVRMRDDNGREVPVMHACGHDLHCTLLLGLAELMVRFKDHWRGTLLLVGQPGEESSDGAEALLRAGLYDMFAQPDYALAIHVHDSTPAGQMKYLAGHAFAGVDSLDMVIRGIGGHGAYPEKCIDPVVLAAQIILSLQTVISRGKSALDPAVLTIGSIHGGNRRNIIPEEVVLEMTLRTFEKKVRERILAAIERIAQGSAQSAGLPEEWYPLITRGISIPPVINYPTLVERCRVVLQEVLGAENVSVGEPTLGAEDFACYALDGRIPIALLWLGVAHEDDLKVAEAAGKVIPPIHSPYFKVLAEPALHTGLRAMGSVMIDLLK